jgi:class 3 adenylate cyclase
MYLIILNGPMDGRRYTVTPGTLIVGRAPEADIPLPDDPYVSGTHAEFRMDGGGTLTVLDRGSRNGTMLRGEPVTDPAEVRPGDVLQIGRTFLKCTRRNAERSLDDRSGERTSEAILVVDIVGSSRIAQAMGDCVAGKVMNILDGKLEPLLNIYPAEFRKNTGDGFMIVFGSVKYAVRLAVGLLGDLKSDESGRGIHVRMGIHFGETSVLPDGDRRGLAVDMAFRVESVKPDDMHQTVSGIRKDAFPRIDRIFVTEVVHRMIASEQQIQARCIGFFDLKGFTGRHRVYEVSGVSA